MGAHSGDNARYYPASYGYGYGYPVSYGYGYGYPAAMAMAATTVDMVSVAWVTTAAIIGLGWCTTAGMVAWAAGVKPDNSGDRLADPICSTCSRQPNAPITSKPLDTGRIKLKLQDLNVVPSWP